MRLIAAALLAASLTPILASCSGAREGGAVVWTDVPELAVAVELFDSLPGRRSGPSSVELHWKPQLAEALRSAKELPALAVGRYLGGARSRKLFATLDYLLGKGGLSRNAFYPELLEAGVVGGRRILLPLSFNLPVIVFSRGLAAAGDGFTLSLPEMLSQSSAYNRKEGGAFTRMGFSPRWDGRFLVTALQASGAGFAEGRELSWNQRGLEAALGEISDWTYRANGQAALEDDFQFKYLFAPPYRYVDEGRTLFASMDSSDFFVAPEARRAGLDFRWYGREGRITLSDGPAFAGILRGAQGRKAADAFLRWLLTPEAQRAILERSRRARVLEYSFGFAGGFSSLRSVNEEIFPAFFPGLVGHAPPATLLAAPANLPGDWPALEAAVVAPWAVEATARGAALTGEIVPAASTAELAARIEDYRKRGSLP
jgi:hypothetical protein